jgi:mRNA-degrading endonuclease RelE of RelBE toxin-antitoxin system
VFTVVETPTFVRLAGQCWRDDERVAFIDLIAANPDAGDVIPRSGGLRKVRWSGSGRGKRGGVRVIYFSRLAQGEIWLLLVYPKSTHENVSPDVLRQIRKEIEDA